MDQKIEYISKHLHNKLREHLIELYLFGSRAIGDETEGSDYDFLIIVDQKSKEQIAQIREIEVDFLNQFDELSASIIMNQEEWEKSKKLPIGLNILKEGLRI